MPLNNTFNDRATVSKAAGYTSGDIISLFRFPDFMEVEAKVFAEINTISYSIYRDKFPVRALGHTRAKGYTKGTRTVAGQLVFTMLDLPVINHFINMLYNHPDRQLGLLPDELPPFDIVINYLNEMGNRSSSTLIGVELAEGNQVITTQDLQVNEQYSFVAHDIIQANHWNTDY